MRIHAFVYCLMVEMLVYINLELFNYILLILLIRFLSEPVPGCERECHHDQHPALCEGLGLRCQSARQVGTGLRYNGTLPDPRKGQVSSCTVYSYIGKLPVLIIFQKSFRLADSKSFSLFITTFISQMYEHLYT